MVGAGPTGKRDRVKAPKASERSRSFRSFVIVAPFPLVPNLRHAPPKHVPHLQLPAVDPFPVREGPPHPQCRQVKRQRGRATHIAGNIASRYRLPLHEVGWAGTWHALEQLPLGGRGDGDGDGDDDDGGNGIALRRNAKWPTRARLADNRATA